MREKNFLKLSNYDKFKCTADKCKFTCCEGWDISIDDETYDRWSKGNDAEKLLGGVKVKSYNGKKEYFINKETFDFCPFLDEKGLCAVVKNHGEEYLSLTCHKFPRIENDFGDKKELSLSCACPEVINIIDAIDKIEFIYNDGCVSKDNLIELKIRESLIDIINKKEFALEEKLLISFEMLLSILQESIIEREDSILDELEKYRNENYIEGYIKTYRQLELSLEEALEDINYLFLDITENYKKVNSLRNILDKIFQYAETERQEILEEDWYKYKKKFQVYNELLEKCIISKIISNCVNEDIKEIIVAFQMIILEYLLVRYSVFLKYCIEGKERVDIEDVKDYIVAFSRIIENNSEAVREFIIDAFEDEILEIGYLCFITLL